MPLLLLTMVCAGVLGPLQSQKLDMHVLCCACLVVQVVEAFKILTEDPQVGVGALPVCLTDMVPACLATPLGACHTAFCVVVGCTGLMEHTLGCPDGKPGS